MLKAVSKRKRKRTGRGAKVAIVASKYNELYVDAMLRRAKEVLRAAGADVIVVRVPGAFEIPVAASRLAQMRNPEFGAIICLGVILRGATTHAQHIGESVSSALAQIQVWDAVPVIHEVLLLENEDQARARCLDRKTNRGAEAARTALEMIDVMRLLKKVANPAC